jgi:hypothetical protein
MNEKRRGFLKVGTLTVASLAIATRAATSFAQDKKGAPPMLDEKDPTAQSLGYKADATKVDKTKFKQYAAGQTCANCQLYQGKPTDASAACPIFTGKSVAGKGWCSAYAKKA